MLRTLSMLSVVIGLVLVAPASRWAMSEEAAKTPAKKARTPDVVYVPTPNDVVDKMLEMAQVKKGDVVYDLGCGDGRIVVAAAKKAPRRPATTSAPSGSRRPGPTSRRTRSRSWPKSSSRISSPST